MRLAEKAYDHIKSLLLAGRVRADDWLPIEDIAQQLGASRQPVMDAMKRLKLEGFIDIVPQVGCRVRSPSVQEIDDFFRLFASGEALVAELAASRAEPADVLGLQLISAQIGTLAGSSQPAAKQGESYRQLNRQLHAEMRRISRSPLLTDVVESLGDRSDFYVALSSQPVFALNIPQAHQEHEAIIAAIAAKKPDKARKAMEQHIFATEKRVLGELNRQAV
ncbi:MAG: GntR family transcriptional regulator [Porticoccaceae bacterium]|jgi:DNA-binding GntR family transcriptional regulator|nr:GntR family transcriptional regulator [Porticoccaceae bacterium]MEA3301487.1 GntR family transcriptional regulator [Pseudomonadota bacterium]HLS98328.1 GntR family transcriptional regulator [Porticoccaceae bacterium]